MRAKGGAVITSSQWAKRTAQDGPPTSGRLFAVPTHDERGRVTTLVGILDNPPVDGSGDAKLRQRAARLKALNEITSSAASATNLERFLTVVLTRTLKTLRCDCGAIWTGDVHVVRGAPNIGATIAQAGRKAKPTPTGLNAVSDWRGASGRAAKVLAPLMARVGIRATLTVPIKVKGRIIGGCAIASTHPRPWGPEDAALAEAVTQQIGTTAERLRLFHDTQDRARLMDRLLALSGTLNHPRTIARTLAAIGTGARKLSRAPWVAVYLRGPDGTINCPWSKGLSSGFLTHVLQLENHLTAARLMQQVKPKRLRLAGGRMVEGTKPFIISDARALPSGSRLLRLAEHQGVRSVGFWPLTYEGRVQAVLTCYYNTPWRWSPAEADVFLAFSWQASIALQNAHLYEAQAERRTELETLYHLSRQLRAAQSPEDMYPVLVEHAVRMLQADGATLSLLTGDHQVLTRSYTRGVRAAKVGSTFPAAGSFSGEVIATGKPMVTADVSRVRIPKWFSQAQRRVLGPAVLVALRSEEEIIGTLSLARVRRARPRPFTEREIRLLEGIAEIGGSSIRRARLYEHLEQSHLQMILALVRALDAKDHHIAGHSERIAGWAIRLARALHCADDEVQDIQWAALLHDLGKVGIPDRLLHKPGPLLKKEWEVMQRHSVIGEEILSSGERMRRIGKIVRHHQEHWDGSGYPDGLRGKHIPMGSRVLAVVDAYGAMTEDRAYRRARSSRDALAELRRYAGTQFDPALVERFCPMIGRRHRPSA